MITQSEVHATVARRAVAGVSVVGPAEIAQAIPMYRYNCTGPVAVDGPRAFYFHVQPGVRGRLVEEDVRRAVVGGEHDVGASIAIDVPERSAAGNIKLLKRSAAERSDICKFIAGVVNEEILFLKRRGLSALFLTKGYGGVGDEEIEPAVVIVVGPSCAETGVGVGDGKQAALPGDVKEIGHTRGGHVFFSKERRALAHQVHDEQV